MIESKSVEYDLRYIQSVIGLLENYLLSEDIFWPSSVKPPEGEPEYPRLTLDGILLARARLEGRPMPRQQKDQVDQAITDLELYRSKWRVAWEKKAGLCYRVRLRMWGNFIQEYKDNSYENADRYPNEVRLRAMISLSRSEIREQDRIGIEFLHGLDRYLKSVLVPGKFIWEDEIKGGFPPDEYWFLYGYLPPVFQKPGV